MSIFSGIIISKIQSFNNTVYVLSARDKQQTGCCPLNVKRARIRSVVFCKPVRIRSAHDCGVRLSVLIFKSAVYSMKIARCLSFQYLPNFPGQVDNIERLLDESTTPLVQDLLRLAVKAVTAAEDHPYRRIRLSDTIKSLTP